MLVYQRVYPVPQVHRMVPMALAVLKITKLHVERYLTQWQVIGRTPIWSAIPQKFIKPP